MADVYKAAEKQEQNTTCKVCAIKKCTRGRAQNDQKTTKCCQTKDHFPITSEFQKISRIWRCEKTMTPPLVFKQSQSGKRHP